MIVLPCCGMMITYDIQKVSNCTRKERVTAQRLLNNKDETEKTPGDRAAVLRYRSKAINKTIKVYQEELQRAECNLFYLYPRPVSFIDQTDSTLETKYIWEQVCSALPINHQK